ncbi:hypothetical protein MNB_SV-3-906 [hydrothermal vent metagenome]|uniref:Uncharacterized protein n=1 Tax=hydrothermal vent metagenome TaxID=652676 RepID=A0A1W1BEM6_9ZZZZ
MVGKIHEKREGIVLTELDTTPEPFVRLEEENNVTTFVIPVTNINEAKLELHAIVNGKAYINDSWMDIDQSILGYKLKFIGKRGVVLRNENHIKKLFLKKQKNSFIQLEER